MQKKRIIVDKKEVDYIWEKIQEKQMIFHPFFMPNGNLLSIDYIDCIKENAGIIVLDRNIFSGLLNLAENGSLEDKTEIENIGLIMAWAAINDMEISPGYAVQEYSTQTGSEEDADIELQKFREIVSHYSFLDWIELAEKKKDSIEAYIYSQNKMKTSISNSDGTVHYWIAYACMIHLAILLRDKKKTRKERICDYYNWMYTNVCTSSLINIYALMVLTSVQDVKPPKHVYALDVQKVLKGCRNQAWDLTYLANWMKVFTINEYAKEPFFATNDKMLKLIFSNWVSWYQDNEIWYEDHLVRKEREQLFHIIDNFEKDRIIPKIDKKSMKELVSKEKVLLMQHAGN